jgi:cell division septation protein DedD
MNEKTKLLIFDKKEVLLIFVFTILTAVISFSIGVKVGKTYTYRLDGFMPEDKKEVEQASAIDLKSTEEEQMQDLISEKKNNASTEKNADVNGEEQNDTSYNKLREEFERLDQAPEKKSPESISVPDQAMNNSNAQPVAVEQDAQEQLTLRKDLPNREKYLGKYTIQLGSHRNLSEAKKFADGFKVLGYNPIINEVELANKGVWYRVSLGIFESSAQAKDYIKKEHSLFQGQDYVIVVIK